MSSEQNQKEFEELLKGSSVRPPTGSVFAELNSGNAPPMVRMILLQMAFQFLSKRKQLKNIYKALLIGLVCFFLMARDLNTFISTRNPNVYNVIGAHRASDIDFIQNQLELAKQCSIKMDEESCAPFQHVTQRLNVTQVEELRYVLIDKPNLRELYDKTETFIRKKTERSTKNPSQGNRYLQTYMDLSSYSIFVIMMTIYLDKHQNFARQMTIVSLLVFATISFQLKAPKEGDTENTIIQIVNRIPFLSQFTYFELSYMVKSLIYPNLYHMAVFMSRMIDLDPLIKIRETLQNAQRQLSRSIVLCELITDINGTLATPDIDQIPAINSEQKESELDNQLEEKKDALEEEEEIDPVESEKNKKIEAVEAEQKKNQLDLEKYKKANEHILRAYKWVCEMRRIDTTDYMRSRFEKSRNEEKSISFVGKMGKLVKMVFIFGVVAFMAGPTLYNAVAPQFGMQPFGGAPETQQTTQKPTTKEDYAKVAEEREEKERARQRQKQQEFDDIYDSGGNNQDL